ncbi:MAG: hypothetical protein JXR23_10660, partial [Pontiellaceae bacterium]|nr:hypothetical protein [Pontiellaceae bacterium]
PQLRRRNRIKTIAGTLAIEGNTLTEEQVMAILDGKRVMGAALELAWDVMRFWVCEIRDDTDACIRRIQDWVNQ